LDALQFHADTMFSYEPKIGKSFQSRKTEAASFAPDGTRGNPYLFGKGGRHGGNCPAIT
jgi:hypothetical protein